jgi:hypothetical protein
MKRRITHLMVFALVVSTTWSPSIPGFSKSPTNTAAARLFPTLKSKRKCLGVRLVFTANIFCKMSLLYVQLRAMLEQSLNTALTLLAESLDDLLSHGISKVHPLD